MSKLKDGHGWLGGLTTASTKSKCRDVKPYCRGADRNAVLSGRNAVLPALTDTTDLIWHFSTPDLQKWKAGVIKDGATRFDPE